MGVTPIYGLPFPEPGWPPDVPEDMENLAEAVEDELDRIDSFNTAGFRLLDIVYYTTPGSFNFTKASFPGMQLVEVAVQAGGGAGGGVPATNASQGGCGAGGAGGGYAEVAILEASLAASETVTVGAGGTPVSGGIGTNGGDSSFGSFAITGGGAGGNFFHGTTGGSIANPVGGSATAGNLLVTGGGGGSAVFRGAAANLAIGGAGGGSQLGSGGLQVCPAFSTFPGQPASGFGGGGSGAANMPSQTAVAGGPGTGGIVIVRVYA